MSHVFYASPSRTIPSPCAANASRSSIAPASAFWTRAAAPLSCLGHSHPRVIEAMQAQAARLASLCPQQLFTKEPAEALADHLIERASAGIDRVSYRSGGSEAVEAAHQNRKAPCITEDLVTETGPRPQTYLLTIAKDDNKSWKVLWLMEIYFNHFL